MNKEILTILDKTLDIIDKINDRLLCIEDYDLYNCGMDIRNLRSEIVVLEGILNEKENYR